MEVYFIFDIKEELKKLYLDNEIVLFDLLRQIYLLDKNDIDFGYTSFKQIINFIDKDKLDRDIFIKYHKLIPYSKVGGIHIFNNAYKNEITKLMVKKAYLKLEIKDFSNVLLNQVKNYSNNFFACDFKNKNFFFLNY